jgi:hypothetical protein
VLGKAIFEKRHVGEGPPKGNRMFRMKVMRRNIWGALWVPGAMQQIRAGMRSTFISPEIMGESERY